VIVGNDLAPSNVQAYFEDDPSLKGVSLIVGRSDIHWEGYDDWASLCSDPRIFSEGNGQYRLACDDISFDLRVSSDGTSMTLDWFDLLILHLVRH